MRHAQLLCECVEVRIAGLVNRFADANGAVRAVGGRDPAFEEPSIECLAAAAIDDEALRDILLQTRSRHDDLEDGTRRQLRLDSFVEQRLARIGHQRVPFVARDAHRKLVGIERRAADHCQDFAVTRVHGNDRAGLSLQRLFCGNLQIQIDGEL